MKSQFNKSEVAIVVVTLLILAAVWAINGFEDTWLYVIAGIIVIPASWFLFGKKDNDR